MAAAAMVHFSIYAPEPARGKESDNEEGIKRKKSWLPDRSNERPDGPERWQSTDLPFNRSQSPARQRLMTQQTHDQHPEYDFDIPPQPLASALNRFGEQTGIQFAYSTEDVENVRTGGVSGRRTSEDALRLLLVDTGLDYRVTGTKTITIEKRTGADVGATAAAGMALGIGAVAAGSQAVQSDGGTIDAPTDGTASKPVKVPEVVIKEIRDRPKPWEEAVDGYKADSSSTVTRTPMSIDESPTSIGVVTRDVIRDTFARTRLRSGRSPRLRSYRRTGFRFARQTGSTLMQAVGEECRSRTPDAGHVFVAS